MDVFGRLRGRRLSIRVTLLPAWYVHQTLDFRRMRLLFVQALCEILREKLGGEKKAGHG
jgi:hypothetical protein